jgi:poly(A) polymerase
VTSVPPRLQRLVAPDAPAPALAERLLAGGFRCWLVGGPLRDAFLDEQGAGADLDFTTDARPDDIEAAVTGWADAVWTQGKRFGTIGCRKDGRTLEITTLRAEVYHADSRKPEVAFGDSIEGDLLRRDFTINAMALELPTLEFVDPYDGLVDLAARRLRTPGPPEDSFLDDPLRMMRAARFIARFGLTPDPELVAAVERLHDRLEIVSAERVRDELDKLLLVPDPSAGLWFLARAHLSDEFLPELNSMELEQDPLHQHKDVLAHTIAVVANTRPELLVRLASAITA